MRMIYGQLMKNISDMYLQTTSKEEIQNNP